MDDEALMCQYLVPACGRADAATVRLHAQEFPRWELIRDRQAAKGNVLQVAAYGLPREAVLAARSYYVQHVAVIDVRIRVAAREKRDPRRAAREAGGTRLPHPGTPRPRVRP